MPAAAALTPSKTPNGFGHAWGRALLSGFLVALPLLVGGLASPPAAAQDPGAASPVPVASGVPVAELLPTAPARYTVVAGDTLWSVASRYLRDPWRWPDLWGLDAQQRSSSQALRPGQTLQLVRQDGVARLQSAGAGGLQVVASATVPTTRVGPQVRVQDLPSGSIPAIPVRQIEPFLNDAVVFDTDPFALAPRVVATPESRVLLTRGDMAYVDGELLGQTQWRLFRAATPLRDPITQEVLGFEARHLGSATLVRPAGQDRQGRPVPATFRIDDARLEIGVGDRLAPAVPRSFPDYVPRAPKRPIEGRIVGLYGDALNAGIGQVVSINQGRQQGLETGHVLALWRTGESLRDEVQGRPAPISLPDERHGLLFVFRVFEQVSYALVVSAQDTVVRGDRFTQP